MTRNVTIVTVGGVWGSPSWEVHYDVPHETFRAVHRREDGTEVEYYVADEPCPHSVDLHAGQERIGSSTYSNGTRYTSIETSFHWTVPRVAVAYNEGGHANTGICLDCILDWASRPDST